MVPVLPASSRSFPCTGPAPALNRRQPRATAAHHRWPPRPAATAEFRGVPLRRRGGGAAGSALVSIGTMQSSEGGTRSMAERRTLIAGNWKMNGLLEEGRALAGELRRRLDGAGAVSFDLAVFP